MVQGLMMSEPSLLLAESGKWMKRNGQNHPPAGDVTSALFCTVLVLIGACRTGFGTSGTGKCAVRGLPVSLGGRWNGRHWRHRVDAHQFRFRHADGSAALLCRYGSPGRRSRHDDAPDGRPRDRRSRMDHLRVCVCIRGGQGARHRVGIPGSSSCTASRRTWSTRARTFRNWCSSCSRGCLRSSRRP